MSRFNPPVPLGVTITHTDEHGPVWSDGVRRESVPDADWSPWHPMSDPRDLKTLGKLGEELGEASAAVSRCIIQGIDEQEPVTRVVNRHWLEDELADVRVNMKLAIERFGLDEQRMAAREARKEKQLRGWHEEA